MALGSALCAACATLLIQRGLQRSNFYAGAWINVVVGAVAAWSAKLLLVPWHAYTWRAVPYFVFSGVVGTAGAPLFVLLITYFMPREGARLHWRLVVGAVMIVLGVVVLTG